MKYDMHLISREELKQKLERGDRFQLVMALGDWQYRAKHIRNTVLKQAPPCYLECTEFVINYRCPG